MKKEQKAVVVWLTGLPCSGKTTLAREIEAYLDKKNLPVQVLDGDVVRETICKDLGFSKEDRNKNIERISYIAQMLSNNGINVISAFVSPYEEMRGFARKICNNFIEVYVKCDVGECRARDVKGMYKKAQKGEIKDFTGVQDPFEIPKNPEIIVDTKENSIDDSVQKILNFLKENYDI